MASSLYSSTGAAAGTSPASSSPSAVCSAALAASISAWRAAWASAISRCLMVWVRTCDRTTYVIIPWQRQVQLHGYPLLPLISEQHRIHYRMLNNS